MSAWFQARFPVVVQLSIYRLTKKRKHVKYKKGTKYQNWQNLLAPPPRLQVQLPVNSTFDNNPPPPLKKSPPLNVLKVSLKKKKVFKRRTSTGSGLFAFESNALAQTFHQIVSKRVETFNVPHVVASRHIKREKVSFPVGVHRSKTPLVKITKLNSITTFWSLI